MTNSLHVALSDLGHFRAQESIATCVMEATEFDFEVVCDLRGCSQAQNGKKLSGTIACQNSMAQSPSGYAA